MARWCQVALERRFERSHGAKLALERRFQRSNGAKLAQERRFGCPSAPSGPWNDVLGVLASKKTPAAPKHLAEILYISNRVFLSVFSGAVALAAPSEGLLAPICKASGI